MTVAPQVTAVIPAKNEAATIADIVRGCLHFVPAVLVVDGHSHDQTRAEAEAAGARVVLDGGAGKGDAIRTAARHVASEIVVFLDADGSHDPADIPRLIAPLLRGEADHVGGSRLIGGSSELHGGFDEFFRLLGSSFITACINKRFRCRLSDSQNGFRALRTEVLRALELRENITTIEQEMVIATLKKGYRLVEVPAHEYARRAGRSHIVLWRDGWRYGYQLMRDLWF